MNKAFEILRLYPSLSILDSVKIMARILLCVKPIMKILEKHLPEHGRILDLGCGYGVISHLIAKDHPERSVIGVDVSEHRIRTAKSCSGNLRFIRANIVSFPGNYITLFDAIIVIDTLYLLSYENQEKVIRYCYESLDNKGILIVKDNYKARNWRYFYTYAEEKLKTRIGVYGKENSDSNLCYWRFEDFLELMKNVGFEAEGTRMNGFLPYPAVFYVGRKR